MTLAKMIYRTFMPAGARLRLAGIRLRLAEGRQRLMSQNRRTLIADLRVRLGLHHAVATTRFVRLHVDLRDKYIGRSLYIDGVFDGTETALLIPLFCPGMVVYDIGANIGYHTTLAAKLVGPTGRVIAFEPDPYNYSLLCRNIKLNRLRNVTTYNMALGDTTGTAELYQSVQNYGDHRLYQPSEEDDRLRVHVPVARLDDVVRDQNLPFPNFIKIDVQGYEGRVIAGADNVWSAAVFNQLFMEYWPPEIRRTGIDPAVVIAALRQGGWGGTVVTEHTAPHPLDWDRLPIDLAAVEFDDPAKAFVNLLLMRAKP